VPNFLFYFLEFLLQPTIFLVDHPCILESVLIDPMKVVRVLLFDSNHEGCLLLEFELFEVIKVLLYIFAILQMLERPISQISLMVMQVIIDN
jgi:hypothetical protein